MPFELGGVVAWAKNNIFPDARVCFFVKGEKNLSFPENKKHVYVF